MDLRLIMNNTNRLEQDILNYCKERNMEKIDIIRADLLGQRSKLDFFMSKFIDKYGSKLDEKRDDSYNRFYTDKSNEYSGINRLLRVIDAYSK
jgi:hypothetical protein